MSKLARKPIQLGKVQASYDNQILTLKGEFGETTLKLIDEVQLNINDNEISVQSDKKNMLGLYSALIRNMVIGVTSQFYENLILKGVGYRVSISNNELNFNLGYSHPVTYKLPEFVNAEIVSPTEIKLSGINKQHVGQVAAEIIQLRPAKKDPYKEKGIKRVRDRIIKKVGKKVK